MKYLTYESAEEEVSLNPPNEQAHDGVDYAHETSCQRQGSREGLHLPLIIDQRFREIVLD